MGALKEVWFLQLKFPFLKKPLVRTSLTELPHRDLQSECGSDRQCSQLPAHPHQAEGHGGRSLCGAPGAWGPMGFFRQPQKGTPLAGSNPTASWPLWASQYLSLNFSLSLLA